MHRRLVVPIAVVASVGGLAGVAHGDQGWPPPAGARPGPVDVAGLSFGAGIGWTRSSCEAAVLWQPAFRRRSVFSVPGPCPATSTGRGVAAVSVSGNRIAFLSYVGGNTREWRLWTATFTAKRPLLLRAASADADSLPPILLGNGGEDGIPYAVGRQIVVLAGDGHRALTWQAPADIVALAVQSGMLAATLADGTVSTVSLSSAKTTISYIQAGARAALAIKGGAVIDAADGIYLRKGTRTLRFDVPADAHMLGYDNGWVVYASGREIHLYSYRRKQDVLARTVRTGPVFAAAGRLGMGWTNGRSLCWSIFSYLSGKPLPFSAACDG